MILNVYLNVYRMRVRSFPLTSHAYCLETDMKRPDDRIAFLKLPPNVGNHHCYGTFVVH